MYEVLPITPVIQRLIMDGANAKQLMEHARSNGMKTLRESAIHKLLEGVTSFEEVLRLTVD